MSFTLGECTGGPAFPWLPFPGAGVGGRGGGGGGGGGYLPDVSRSGMRNRGDGAFGWGGGAASARATLARYVEASKNFFMLEGVWEVVENAKGL